ncbi:hypothetical protein GUJ93_ZPchr0002g23935 [Zizania palustris]|nr:hypothetical protein GUJ93_ZPchr0002g23935 [Zizania palustris]
MTTQEELELQLDVADELYGGLDEQGPETTRKRRLTADQVWVLEQSFEEEKQKLEPERKSELARRLGIAPRQVAVWFQNRRARWKTKQLEQDFHRLKAAHNELLAGRDALVADNESLRSQMILLTEKLRANEKSPAPAPAEQTAVVVATHAAAAAGGAKSQHEEGSLCAGTTTYGGAPPAVAPLFAGSGRAAANDSPESYFAGARSPPSSSEDDCGGDEGPSPSPSPFFLPDAVEEAQLNCLAWFWN